MKIKLLILASLFIVILACNNDSIVWDDEYDISVMSFNLRYDTDEDGDNKWRNRKEACLEMIKETSPSVFGIQEGLENQVTYLDDNLSDYKYVGVGRDDGEYFGEYCAVFYSTQKFELLDSDTFWLSESPEIPSHGWDAVCKRIVTWVKLKDQNNGQVVYVFNTHFDHEGKEAREQSAKLLVAKIAEIVSDNVPVFITGDFNALKNNPILNPIFEHNFLDSRQEAKVSDNIKSFNFFGKWLLNSNIDFIFFKNADVLAFRTINKDYKVPFISDHYPIISYFNY